MKEPCKNEFSSARFLLKSSDDENHITHGSVLKGFPFDFPPFDSNVVTWDSGFQSAFVFVEFIDNRGCGSQCSRGLQQISQALGLVDSQLSFLLDDHRKNERNSHFFEFPFITGDGRLQGGNFLIEFLSSFVAGDISALGVDLLRKSSRIMVVCCGLAGEQSLILIPITGGRGLCGQEKHQHLASAPRFENH
ncbi:MAG: hypothetical protein KDA84_03930 [Planctomycetaceae bacterium]|nr:hypothetical protein [Planctomycetaceae bacterium]